MLRGDVSDWVVGGELMVGASEFPRGQTLQTERVRVFSAVYVASTDTTVVTVFPRLQFRHYAGETNGDRFDTGVAYLERSIVVTTAEWFLRLY